MRTILTWATVCALSLAIPAAVMAQPLPPAKPTDNPFKPTSGQPGKDVVWVPTAQALVDRMLDSAGATPADNHIDLG